jgi:predicted DNA-binding protein with PD1-like motif
LYGIIVAAAFGIVASALLLLIYGVNYAHVVAIPAGLYYGGLAFIQHFVLRVVLIVFRRTPVRFVRFLNHATEQDVLRRVGGGYIFTHRSLMQHFAELSDADDLTRRQTSSNGETALSTALAAISPVASAPVENRTSLGGDFTPVGYRLDVRVLDLAADQDLLRQINKFVEDNGISFGTILACTGTLSHVMLRQREQTEPTGIAGQLRIVSLSAVIHQPHQSDVYIVVSDEKGELHGGLLQEGSRTLVPTQVLLGVLQA